LAHLLAKKWLTLNDARNQNAWSPRFYFIHKKQLAISGTSILLQKSPISSCKQYRPQKSKLPSGKDKTTTSIRGFRPGRRYFPNSGNSGSDFAAFPNRLLLSFTH